MTKQECHILNKVVIRGHKLFTTPYTLFINNLFFTELGRDRVRSEVTSPVFPSCSKDTFFLVQFHGIFIVCDSVGIYRTNVRLYLIKFFVQSLSSPRKRSNLEPQSSSFFPRFHTTHRSTRSVTCIILQCVNYKQIFTLSHLKVFSLCPRTILVPNEIEKCVKPSAKTEKEDSTLKTPVMTVLPFQSLRIDTSLDLLPGKTRGQTGVTISVRRIFFCFGGLPPFLLIRLTMCIYEYIHSTACVV